MSDDDKPTYEVGYGKPPTASRFKPGQSGNPRGRPKGAKNMATIVTEELNAQVIVNENGKRRKVSKRAAIIKQFVNRAAGGDHRFITMALDEMRALENTPVPSADAQTLNKEEQRVLDSLRERLQRQRIDPAMPPHEIEGEEK